MQTPLVSISCITYNHEPYIRQCLDGFIMQRTTFRYEVLIHDDASDDGAEEIIREYEAKYPDIIKPLYEKENQWKKGRRGSAVFNFPRAKGKYIALCEGDDYWTDPLKLQKQVVFLERNESYGMTFSKALIWDENQKSITDSFGKDFKSIERLLLGNTIPTPTVLFRQKYTQEFMSNVDYKNKDWLMGDYPLWLYISSRSKVKFHNETFSIYRRLENSASHSQNINKELLFLKSYRDIRMFYSKSLNYEHLENKILGYFFNSYARRVLTSGDKNILTEFLEEIDEYKYNSCKIYAIKLILTYKLSRNFYRTYFTFRN